VLERTTTWLLANIAPDASTAALIEDLGAGFARVRGDFGQVVHGADRETFVKLVAELETAGVDRPLAERLITLRFLPELLEILYVGREHSTDPLEAASAFYLAAERFGTASLRERIVEAVGTDPWERRHARALVDDIDRAQRALTRKVLARCGEGDDAHACLAELARTGGREMEEYRTTMQELDAAGTPPLAAYALAVRALGDVAAAV
jgi:NAD-specific glutamate dehydrogenase